jgi:hypothetical protein
VLRVAKLFGLFLAGTTSLLILLFLLLFVAAITVENASDADLRNFKVSFAEKEVSTAGDLKAGRSQWMWGLVNFDPIVVKYDFGERRLAYRCGYLAGVLDRHQSFTVGLDGTMPNCQVVDLPKDAK